MARMIGRTKSWVWWLLGTLCALVFSGQAWGAGIDPIAAEYGPRIPDPTRGPPPSVQPAVSEAERAEIKGVIEQYLAPVAAAAPSEAEQQELAGLLTQLASDERPERLQARARLVELGPVALEALRTLAAGTDETARTARDLVAAIEAGARETYVSQLVQRGEAARLVVGEEQLKAAEAYRTAEAEAQAAQARFDSVKNQRRDPNPDVFDKLQQEAARLRAAAEAARAKSDALSGLASRLTPVVAPPPIEPIDEPPVYAKYGMRPMYGVRPRPRPIIEDAQPAYGVIYQPPEEQMQARYGVRAPRE